MIVLISMTNYSYAQMQNDSSDKHVLAMLKDFYTSYIIESSKMSPTQTQKLNSIKAKYCTKGLLDKIEKQFKSGELDYDPFLKAQDVDTGWLKTLSFSKDLKKPSSYVVSYTDTNSSTKVNIYVTVVKKNEGLRITNVW